MLQTAHFFSGILLYQVAVKFFGMSINPAEGVLLAVSSALVDLDYLIYWHKHRKSPFHTPLFAISLIVAGLFFKPLIFAGLGVLLHLVLDSLDYGIMWLYPFKKESYGLNLLHYDPKNFPTRIERISYDLKLYFSNKSFLLLEIFFFIAALLLAAS